MNTITGDGSARVSPATPSDSLALLRAQLDAALQENARLRAERDAFAADWHECAGALCELVLHPEVPVAVVDEIRERAVARRGARR